MAENGNESLQFQIWKQTTNTKVKNASSKKSKLIQEKKRAICAYRRWARELKEATREKWEKGDFY
jgi:hypothetical protein